MIEEKEGGGVWIPSVTWRRLLRRHRRRWQQQEQRESDLRKVAAFKSPAALDGDCTPAYHLLQSVSTFHRSSDVGCPLTRSQRCAVDRRRPAGALLSEPECLPQEPSVRYGSSRRQSIGRCQHPRVHRGTGISHRRVWSRRAILQSMNRRCRRLRHAREVAFHRSTTNPDVGVRFDCNFCSFLQQGPSEKNLRRELFPHRHSCGMRGQPNRKWKPVSDVPSGCCCCCCFKQRSCKLRLIGGLIATV